MSTEDPRGDWGEWTPGKGVERIRIEMPGVMPDLTEADYAAAEAVIAAASKPAGPALLDVIRRYGAMRVNLEVVPNDRNRAAVVELIGQIEKRIEEDQAAAYARGISEGQRLRAEKLDALTRGAYEDGRGDGRVEGRRQATEGWEREWGGRWMQDAVEPTDDVYLCSSETDARALEERSGGYRRAESRTVGPWEPVEQPEPARGVGWRLARDEEIQAAAEPPEDGER